MSGRGRPAGFDRNTVLHKAMLLFWEKGYHLPSLSSRFLIKYKYNGFHMGSSYMVTQPSDRFPTCTKLLLSVAAYSIGNQTV